MNNRDSETRKIIRKGLDQDESVCHHWVEMLKYSGTPYSINKID